MSLVNLLALPVTPALAAIGFAAVLVGSLVVVEEADLKRRRPLETGKR